MDVTEEITTEDNFTKDNMEKQPSRIEELKNETNEELKVLEKQLSRIDDMKKNSIKRLEEKKSELQRYSDADEIRKQHEKTLQEIKATEADIEERKLSLTLLNQTIANLDEQIAKIQVEHDRIAGEIEVKKNRLQEKLDFLAELQNQINRLVLLLKEEQDMFQKQIEDIQRQKEELKSKNLSETTLKRELQLLDDALMDVYGKHEQIMSQLTLKLSQEIDPAFQTEILNEIQRQMSQKKFLTEQQIKEIMEHERYKFDIQGEHEMTEDLVELVEKVHMIESGRRLTEEERIMLTKMGLIVTPSDRIITKDDQVLTLDEVRMMALTKKLQLDDNLEEEDEEIQVESKKIDVIEPHLEKTIFGSFLSQGSTTISTESTKSTEIEKVDIQYLKHVFGRALTLGLAEITAVQPTDPIHYLAHWLFKYRHNQELDEIKQKEVEELLAERTRLENARTHEEIEAEAKQAMWDIWLRTEGIIMDKEFENQTYEAEEEDVDELAFLNQLDFNPEMMRT